jgi:methylenetetrahydrofolate reductase (NADPH)
MIKPYVAAINFTDCPSATSRMSSLACCLTALEHGAEPIMQIAARDRTRVGLQAEVIGAAGLRIGNILCLSGDNPCMGPSPRSRMDIIDLDSIQMLWILRRMRDEGIYLDGRTIKNPPKFFLGAAASPHASRPHYQALREHKKINAGGQFFQTNLVYDPARFEVWLDELAKRNVLDKVYVLVGITPLKSYKMARYLNDEVPGVFIPDHLLDRLEKAGEKEKEEGFQITLELIDQVKNRGGINGIHLMPVMWEAVVPRVVTEAGLLPPDFVAPTNHEELITATSPGTTA